MSAVVTQADESAADLLFNRETSPTLHARAKGVLARHRSEAVEELVEVLATIAEAARNACDARQHPSLTEALFDADALISKHRGEQG